MPCRKHGRKDLSENADYDVARDEQAKIASRINEIEEILRNYEIIKDNETNNLGKWVQIEIIDGEDAGISEEYKIVGSGSRPDQRFDFQCFVGTCDYQS